MIKWGLYAVIWVAALYVSMDFAQKSSRGVSLQAYIGIESPLFRDIRNRANGVTETSYRGE